MHRVRGEGGRFHSNDPKDDHQSQQQQQQQQAVAHQQLTTSLIQQMSGGDVTAATSSQSAAGTSIQPRQHPTSRVMASQLQAITQTLPPGTSLSIPSSQHTNPHIIRLTVSFITTFHFQKKSDMWIDTRGFFRVFHYVKKQN